MLNNQSETGQETDPHLARRVTPDEFSSAVVAIQKRKAEQEKLLSETVAVDEVVRDLNIDATPEEILREVEDQRQAKAKAAMEAAAAKTRRNSYAATPIAVQTNTRTRSPFRWIFRAAIGLAVIAAVSNIFGNPSRIFTPNVSEPLSSVRPGHHVTIVNSELDKLLKGASPSTITVTDNEYLHDSPWTLVEENGQYYIWAYTKDPLPASLDAQPITLCNDSGDVQGDDAKELTVPLKSLAGDSVEGDGDDGTITVQKLVLDNHKDDEWTDN
jgi:hypothetical protein